ncbi:1-(5-phosphoribosyl)-5-[(5-phosphoribosylamino)methylideneamino]imidazole-4-carboxamide isomerase [Thermoanaerobacterium thermosaccharolyticum]|jgi:phosphoribosylformimino-5-aminoimidazole carboxamide ribotide isomerase|uniref:1-(5-phosphoribosyl)-5-[(5- phosphoribosylamino)methylideneamino]imidazole-4- carboxamide isomerase n=1 Tax=Thermoanaerobacterium thermosaccharolyticum TaxID=1517 RepID=UPI001780C131|nr:1-(5-phosphoribosyl)-5-[(5-phosphoribosylamino)methylideneamino]imidazole-4-carboxamide isomerase [Thermoanaerobacterium thermosaccharolyticum]MBE0069695.1 1-(5-phosphoribosyl)-5-[(5-phosphoribosylamino)methylideneamino]imidazole-4-carboxamide isomerase [Thermoanaerobacterium thermosaccharolyticum]MBE0229397.1 1-(5-phosphoribosyl)-5-[(5-phosphoribosylamino)methylideneamino]imidazole-4-carboxamide isomerase [Thermoanaerobacterium thermosaccharolyticum]
MIIIPAIDIIDGKCVRLTMGDYETSTVYFQNPEDAAKIWGDYGAKRIHVVDLDGAKEGRLVNSKSLENIRKSFSGEIEVGGGIRNLETAKHLFNLGIDYIILGSIAVYNKNFVKGLVLEYGDKIIVGIDAKDGYVATKGWLKKSDIRDDALASDMKEIGIGTVIYTDIRKDGMMEGPNFDSIKKIIETPINVIASGGITTLEDILKLKEIGAYGAIIGKALYTNKIDLKEVLEVL